MAGFWYPYADFADAQRRLCAYADRAVRPGCGITYSDGVSIGVVRRPANPAAAVWLNVRRHAIAAPANRPAQRPGVVQRLETWFWQAMESYGEAEIQRSQAELAASQAMVKAIHDDVWLPAHQWLLRHKLVADGVAVALDVVGVVAGVAFVIAAAPELLGGAAVIGTLGLVTGGLATTGSFILLGIDGTVFGAEVSGNEAFSKKVEDNQTVGWLRVTATVMLLPDIPVGGMRALREVGVLADEAREARAAARTFDAQAEAQRLRTQRIHNPARHPGPVNRHLARARRLARAAEESRADVTAAQHRMALLTARDVNASFVASPGSAALLAGLPPSVLMSEAGIRRDEEFLKMLAPEHGMPRDVRLEMRVSGVNHVAREGAR